MNIGKSVLVNNEGKDEMSVLRVLYVGILKTTAEEVLSSMNASYAAAMEVSSRKAYREQSVEDTEQKPVGGCVLISNAAVLGFIESSSARVEMFLRTLGCSAHLSSLKVISSTEDCPVCEFSSFGMYSANPPSEDAVDIDSEGACNATASVTAKLFASNERAKDGSSFNFPKYPSNSSETKVAAATILPLSKLHGQSMPSLTRINACAQSTKFASFDEFLDIYASPIDVELGSEIVHPQMPIVVI
jgi:hypothetical protein